ncbi:nucleotide exchange factor GrpE [Robiginitalea sp. M366]|uniref:nucleotide exchange factor GrpE n=1 Tax=Robiginitalea aestuariiviva TaxID=3036903 RepID=UPI00240E8831|nr:nucleotide exchange factor GrpE [Robiginitalea aestuariiviva]MDG1572306.1 nucleotide exchange factor GrpE [Robiginitalea aestuariiviva]
MSTDKDMQQEEVVDPQGGQTAPAGDSEPQGDTGETGGQTADVVEGLKAELAEEKDKFLRLFAEFENYKKRTSRERMELFKTAGQEVITTMLPVLDDFDRALKELGRSEDEELFKGVSLIHNKFREALRSKGLEEISVKEGDAFDAEVHEAVTQIPAPKKSLKGKVVDVIEKGFTLGDKIIRHPKVVVGN